MQNHEGKQTIRNINLKTAAVRAGFSLLAMAYASVHAFEPSTTLVIDEGADLDHPMIVAKKGINAGESNGTSGVDDDSNGFKDDVSGWNQVSGDSHYLPPSVLKFFKDNANDFSVLFEANSEAELGNPEAVIFIHSQPLIKKTIETLSGLSHGTHVAGIVAQYNSSNDKIMSLNVFTPSTVVLQENRPVESKASPKISTVLNKSAIIQYTDALKPLVTTVHAKVENLGPPASFLDSESQVRALIDMSRLESLVKADTIKSYVTASKAGVANISLETNEALLMEGLHEMWIQELMMRRLPLTTLPNREQQKRLTELANGFFEASEKMWAHVFSNNPKTLFVVAAGNGGKLPIPNAGNNEMVRVSPSNLSQTHLNVISVAATNNTGALADFSNFSGKLVNIGAPGVAIESAIVGGLKGRMSGTSMAAPMVAGVAAKMRSVNPELAPEEVRAIIEITGKKHPSLNGRVSSGAVIDAEGAVAMAQNSQKNRQPEGDNDQQTIPPPSNNTLANFGTSSLFDLLAAF